MCTRRAIALTLAALALFSLAAACSSSTKATPEFTKGMTVFLTPSAGPAPVLPSSFVNCVNAKLSPSDRAEVVKVTAPSKAAFLPDSTSVRLTRSANQCDATLTNQLIETSVFSGAPASISAAEKSCATAKIIANLTSLDDTALKGTKSSPVSDALTRAMKACGVNSGG